MRNAPKRRKPFLIPLFAMIGLSVLILGYFTFVQIRGSNTDEIEVSLGVCRDSWQACQGASLRLLSEEIRKHPSAKTIRVYRTNTWPALDDMDRFHTSYYRERKQLFDDHEGTGMLAEWGQVTDDAIYAVAESTGRFDDLVHYGCKDIAP